MVVVLLLEKMWLVEEYPVDSGVRGGVGGLYPCCRSISWFKHWNADLNSWHRFDDMFSKNDISIIVPFVYDLRLMFLIRLWFFVCLLSLLLKSYK